MKKRRAAFLALELLLAVATLTFAVSGRALDGSPGWLERDTLTGDWGGGRTWLEGHGVTLRPRLTQFYQGMTAVDGDNGFAYGAKVDLLLDADFSKLGLWAGFSMTVHLEYNFGKSVNGRGGAFVPVNTALEFPGMAGGDAFDMSSLYLGQRFGDSVSLAARQDQRDRPRGQQVVRGRRRHRLVLEPGLCRSANRRPSPHHPGARAERASRLRPVRVVDLRPEQHGEPDRLRGALRRRRHLPRNRRRSRHHRWPGWPSRARGCVQHHERHEPEGCKATPHFPSRAREPPASRTFAGSSATRSTSNSTGRGATPDEGVGVFGQFGISDGNPNKLYWSALVGVGGTGLIPSRSRTAGAPASTMFP